MKKTLLVGIVGVIGLIVVVLLALPYITNLTVVRDRLAATATKALQHPVSISHLGLRAIPSPGLQIEGLGITERNGSPIVKVEKIIVEVKLGPLLQRRLDVARVIVGQPRLTLTRNADGSLNLPVPPPTQPVVQKPSTGGRGQTFDLVLGDVRVEDGDVTIREQPKRGGAQLLRLQRLHVALKDLSIHGQTLDDFKRSLTGSARVEVKEGSIGKIDALDKILSILSAQRLLGGKLPDRSGKGIPIGSLTGTLRFKDGLMTTDDLKLRSPVLDAVVKGTYNLPDKQVKMVVTAMGTDFDVYGSADNPAVSSRAVEGLKGQTGGLLEKGLQLFK